MHDHRKLGRELDLFGTDPLIGAGLPYWLPAGAAVRHALEEYIRDVERRADYRHVYSPVLGKRELHEISGHWAHYNEDMFPPMDLGGRGARRAGADRPGVCRARHPPGPLPAVPARAEREVRRRPADVAAGRVLLVEVLQAAGLPYEAVPGEAAFYGPKIDVQIADAAGREATLSTVQVDFHQPEQFDLHYVGPDGARHRRVMIHRSIIGSVERAVAHLIERQTD